MIFKEFKLGEKIESNRALLSQFPFLCLLDQNGNKVNPEFINFTKTMADGVPAGWAMKFFDELFTRTKKTILLEGINENEYNYRTLAPSSGMLRVDGNIYNKALQDIFDEIGYRSSRVCAICGGDATAFELGVELPVCEGCKSNFVGGKYRKIIFEEWVKIEDGKQYNYNGKEWVLFEEENNPEKQSED